MANENDAYVLRIGPQTDGTIAIPNPVVFNGNVTFNDDIDLGSSASVVLEETVEYQKGFIVSGDDDTNSRGLDISGACTTPISITGAFTTGINIAADGTTAISVTNAFTGADGIILGGTHSDCGIEIDGTCADGIRIDGACSDNGIEVSSTCTDSVLQATGTYACGITFGGTPTKLIAGGSYGSKLTHQGSELITVAAAGEQTWNLGIGAYIQVDGEDHYGFPLCTLVEYIGTAGTSKLEGAQMMAFLGTVGGSQAARLKTLGGDSTAGMYACWLKVGANTNCVVDSGSRVAPLWLDSQMNCVCSGEEYACFITCGGSKVDAVFGFETTSSGWTYLFSWDETSYDQDPISSSLVDATKNSAGTIKIELNSTTFYIPYYDSGDLV